MMLVESESAVRITRLVGIYISVAVGIYISVAVLWTKMLDVGYSRYQ